MRVLLLVALCAVSFVRAESHVRGRVTDASTGQVMPCTVMIRSADGRVVTEYPGFSGGFRSAGIFDKSIPPGRTEITVRRGFDYGAVSRTVELRKGQTADLEFPLRRRTPLRSLGWICGDSHIHMVHGEHTLNTDFPYLALAGRAEALDYMSVAQQWNLTDPTPEALDAAVREVSRPEFRLFWNMEARNYWQGDASHCMGHAWTFGMRGRTNDGRSVIDEISAMNPHDTEREKIPTPSFDTEALVHALGGIFVYTHPTRWWRGRWGGENGFPVEDNKLLSNMAQELPFDTIAGPTYDALDILMPVEEKSTNDTTQQLWFELLNHGYRIPATASSDSTFDRPGGAVPGIVRVYTRGDDRSGIAAAMKAGRNFVTSGPLLLFRIGDAQPGDIVRRQGTFPVAIQAWASGDIGEHLTRVELIRNGVVVRRFDLAGSEWAKTFDINESETAWYVVRCIGSGPKQVAIANPIYFEAPGFRAPEPTMAQVEANILDEANRQPLDGTCEVLRMIGRKAQVESTCSFAHGVLNVRVPATARLRFSAPGHAPVMKSIFMDTPKLLDMTTNMRREQLLDWNTFEHIRELLGHVRLQVRLPRR